MFLRTKLLIGLFLIPVFSYGQEFVSVCDRSPSVRDAIMHKVFRISRTIECSDDDLLSLIIAEMENLGVRGSSSLKAGDFSGFSSLKYLNLNSEFSSGKLTSLPAGIFSGLSSLEVLDLSFNALTSLPADIFSGLSSLKVLDLRYNALTSLPAGIFFGLSSLEGLILRDNELVALPKGIFSDLSSLEFLNFQYNQINSLPKGIFSDLSSIIKINLSFNPLDDQTIEWLEETNLPIVRTFFENILSEFGG